MQRSQLLYDGLWRCLCPAFDGAALHRAVNRQNLNLGPLLLRPLRRPAKPPRRRIAMTTGAATLVQSRRYETSALSASEAPVDESHAAAGQEDASSSSSGPSSSSGSSSSSSRPETWEERLLASTPPTEETLRASSVDEMVAALVALRDPRRWTWNPNSPDVDQHGRIVQLARHLLACQDLPPGPFIYECMVDAMADPQGSAEGVRRLLDDMAAQGMKPSAAFCHGALEALANHPDYVLRQEIVAIMHEYWFTMDTPAKQSLVVGLLRDEQYELAYTRLTEMIEQGARVDAWVYDIFILVLGKLGFLDEMLLLLYRRKNAAGEAGDPAVSSLLYYALDVCSQAFHYAGTVFAWTCVVRNSLAQPPDGVVENVLGTAARNADARLATEALDLISGRTRAQAHHYEAVVEAFAGGGDVAAAFRTLCIMKEHGIRITRGHTRAIHRALQGRPGLVEEAEAAVRDMARGRAVPRAAVGVIIEAAAQAQGSERAMALYRDVAALCGGELPNAGMVQDMIVHSGEAATARGLAEEYAGRFTEKDDPRRSPVTYGALIAACAEVGQMDLAFRFAKHAMTVGGGGGGAGGGGGGVRAKWVKALVEQAVAREDGRIWPIVDELSKAGDEETSKMVKRVLQQKRVAKMASRWREMTQGAQG